MLGVSLRRSLEPDAQASSTQVARIVQGWLGFFFILVCHQAFAGKAVLSVRLDPSTFDLRPSTEERLLMSTLRRTVPAVGAMIPTHALR
jgi:hypothetical protein